MNRIAYVLGVNLGHILSAGFIVWMASMDKFGVAIGGLAGLYFSDKLRAAHDEYKRLTSKS